MSKQLPKNSRDICAMYGYRGQEPVRSGEAKRHLVYALLVGALVLLALLGCSDDLHSAQAAADDLQDAQQQAVQMHKEALALAELAGAKR